MTIVDFYLTDINILKILKTSTTSKALLKEQNTLSLITKFKKLQIKVWPMGTYELGQETQAPCNQSYPV